MSSSWRRSTMNNGLAGVELRLELFGTYPRDAQLADEELAAGHLHPQVGRHSAADDHEGPTAQAMGETGRLGQLVAEDVAQTDIEPHPEHGSENVENHEPPPRHAERPRQRLTDAVESRQEFRDQERARAP